MSIIAQGLMSIARTCLKTTIQAPTSLSTVSNLAKLCVPNNFSAGFAEIKRMGSSLLRAHKNGLVIPERKKRQPLDGKPFAKGVVLKTLIKKPKKPNSANRKCVLVRLSTGKEMVAYVPGVGHNLQEHNIVLCRVGRVKDCNGVKIKCVRGKYDLSHVIKPDPK